MCIQKYICISQVLIRRYLIFIGKKRAKSYLRKVLLYGLKYGLLDLADEQGKTLYISGKFESI